MRTPATVMVATVFWAAAHLATVGARPTSS
jgi:hypothetical protein